MNTDRQALSERLIEVNTALNWLSVLLENGSVRDWLISMDLAPEQYASTMSDALNNSHFYLGQIQRSINKKLDED